MATPSGLTLKQLIIVILSIVVVGLGSAFGTLELASQFSERSDNNGCVIKSVLNLGAYRSFTSLEKPAKGISAQQIAQTRAAIPYQVNLANNLLPDDSSCKRLIGSKYFAPKVKVVKTKQGIQLALIK